MNKEEITELTSGEISSLWMTYQSETLQKCGIRFFLQHVDDKQIQEILEEMLRLTIKRIDRVKDIFMKEDYPVPEGFTDDDVNLKAPRLFSDILYLEYCLEKLKMELTHFSYPMLDAVKVDVQEFYFEVMQDIQKLEMRAKELAKAKGIYNRAPKIPTPKQVEYVTKESFLAGWLGGKRPLLGIEISQLVFHSKRNALGQAVITAFSQVAKSKEVRRFFERGREISGKHLDIFSTILNDEYLPNSANVLTSEVTDSTEAPFSDKLMMTFITNLIASSIGGYGVSMSISPRRDLGVHYTRLIAEIAQYSDDGAEILIKNGWMEQPPMAADRKELAK
ncbi:DUF3231 family protein [Pseudogracilibacillus sp. SO30301A]|uniref:DUF3231 family protein n=1 Tax=Pseudogracilibacillus sp. SO30301A TaxID=3098291 RepID=UPI00300E6B69